MASKNMGNVGPTDDIVGKFFEGFDSFGQGVSNEVTLTLDVKDNASKQIQNIGKKAEEASKKLKELGDNFARLNQQSTKESGIKTFFGSKEQLKEQLEIIKQLVDTSGKLKEGASKKDANRIFSLGAAYKAQGGDINDVDKGLATFWNNLDSSKQARGSYGITKTSEDFERVFSMIREAIEKEYGEYILNLGKQIVSSIKAPKVKETSQAPEPELEKPQAKKLDERSLKRADDLERSLRATLKDFEQNSGISEDTAKRYIQTYHELLKLFEDTDESIEERVKGATEFLSNIANSISYKDNADAKREQFMKNIGRQSKSGRSKAERFVEGEEPTSYVDKSPYERVSHYVDKDYFEQLSAKDIEAINAYLVSAKNNVDNFNEITGEVVKRAKQLLQDIKAKNIEAIGEQIPTDSNADTGLLYPGKAMLKQFVSEKGQETLSKSHFSGKVKNQILFDYSTEDMLDANKGATDEIRKMYDEVREKIGSTFKSGIDALNEFQARAKEIGLSFEGGKWIEVEPVLRTSTKEESSKTPNPASGEKNKSESGSSSEPTENQKRYDSLEGKNKKAIDAYLKALGDKIKSIEARDEALTEAFKVLDSLDKASDTTLNPEERFKGLNKLFGSKKKANSVLLQEYSNSDTYAKNSAQTTTELTKLYGQEYEKYIKSEQAQIEEHKNKWKAFKRKQIGKNQLFETDDMEKQKQIMEELADTIDKINKSFLKYEEMDFSNDTQKAYIDQLIETDDYINNLIGSNEELTKEQEKEIKAYEKAIEVKKKYYGIRDDEEKEESEKKESKSEKPKSEEPEKKKSETTEPESEKLKQEKKAQKKQAEEKSEQEGAIGSATAQEKKFEETSTATAATVTRQAEAMESARESTEEYTESLNEATEAQERLNNAGAEATTPENKRVLKDDKGNPAETEAEPETEMGSTIKKAQDIFKNLNNDPKALSANEGRLKAIGQILQKNAELADKFLQVISQIDNSSTFVRLMASLKMIAQSTDEDTEKFAKFSKVLDDINNNNGSSTTTRSTSTRSSQTEKPQSQTPQSKVSQDNNDLVEHVKDKIKSLVTLRDEIKKSIYDTDLNAPIYKDEKHPNGLGNSGELYNATEFQKIVDFLKQFNKEELEAIGLNDKFVESLSEVVNQFEHQKSLSNQILKNGNTDAIQKSYLDFNDVLSMLFKNINQIITATQNLGKAQKESFDPNSLIAKTQRLYTAKNEGKADSDYGRTIRRTLKPGLKDNKELADLFDEALGFVNTKEDIQNLIQNIQDFNSTNDLDNAKQNINDFIARLKEANGIITAVSSESDNLGEQDKVDSEEGTDSVATVENTNNATEKLQNKINELKSLVNNITKNFINIDTGEQIREIDETNPNEYFNSHEFKQVNAMLKEFTEDELKAIGFTGDLNEAIKSFSLQVQDYEFLTDEDVLGFDEDELNSRISSFNGYLLELLKNANLLIEAFSKLGQTKDDALSSSEPTSQLSQSSQPSQTSQPKHQEQTQQSGQQGSQTGQPSEASSSTSFGSDLSESIFEKLAKAIQDLADFQKNNPNNRSQQLFLANSKTGQISDVESVIPRVDDKIINDLYGKMGNQADTVIYNQQDFPTALNRSDVKSIFSENALKGILNNLLVSISEVINIDTSVINPDDFTGIYNEFNNAFLANVYKILESTKDQLDQSSLNKSNIDFVSLLQNSAESMMYTILRAIDEGIDSDAVISFDKDYSEFLTQEIQLVLKNCLDGIDGKDVINPSTIIENITPKIAEIYRRILPGFKEEDLPNLSGIIKDTLPDQIIDAFQINENIPKDFIDQMLTIAENALMDSLKKFNYNPNDVYKKFPIQDFVSSLQAGVYPLNNVPVSTPSSLSEPEQSKPQPEKEEKKSSTGHATSTTGKASDGITELDKKVNALNEIIEKIKNTIFDGTVKDDNYVWKQDFQNGSYEEIFNADALNQLVTIFNQFTDEELETIGITKELKDAFDEFNSDLADGQTIDWDEEQKKGVNEAKTLWGEETNYIADDLVEIFEKFQLFIEAFNNAKNEVNNSSGRATTQQKQQKTHSTPSSPSGGQTSRPETANQSGSQASSAQPTPTATPQPQSNLPVIEEVVTKKALQDLTTARTILQEIEDKIKNIPEINSIVGADLDDTRKEFDKIESRANTGDKNWNKNGTSFGGFIQGIRISNTKEFPNGERGGLKDDDTYDTDWLLKQFMVKHEEGKKGKASAYYGTFRNALGKDEAIKQLADKLKEMNQGNQDYDYQKVAEELDKTYQEGYELYKQLQELAAQYAIQRKALTDLRTKLEEHAKNIRTQNSQNGTTGANPWAQAPATQGGTGQASGNNTSSTQGDPNANGKFRGQLVGNLKYSMTKKDVNNMDQNELDQLIQRVQSGLLYFEDLFGNVGKGYDTLSGLYEDFIKKVEQAVQNSGLNAGEMDLSKIRDILNAKGITSKQFYEATPRSGGSSSSTSTPNHPRTSSTSTTTPSPSAPSPAPSSTSTPSPAPSSQPNMSAPQIDLSGLNDYVTKLNEIIALLRKATEEFVQDGKLITSDIGKIINGFIKLRDTLVEVISTLKNDDGSIPEFTFNAQKFKEDLDKAINPFEIILKIQPDSLTAIQNKIAELNAALNAGLQSAPSVESGTEPTTPLPSSDQPVPSAEPIAPTIDVSRLSELKAMLEELVGLLRKATQEFVQDASLVTKEAGKEVSAFIKIQESLQGVIDKLAGLKTDGVSDVPITFLPDFSNILVELDKGLNPFELIIKIHPTSLENAQQDLNQLKLDLDGGSSTPETAENNIDNEAVSLPEQTPDMTEQPKKATSEYEQLSEMIAKVREQLTNLAGQFKVLEEKSAIEGEANLFGSLLTMLKETIPNAIDVKNDAFLGEADYVEMVVEEELKQLEKLKTILEQIGKKVSINIDMKNLNAFNKFLQSIEKTLKANTLNDFKDALVQFQKAVNRINISNSKNNILGVLNKILENKDALKDLVEALKATKQQLDNVSNAQNRQQNNQNPPSGSNQNQPPSNQNSPSSPPSGGGGGGKQNPPSNRPPSPSPKLPTNNPGTSVNNWNRQGYGDPKKYEQDLGKIIKITENWVNAIIKTKDAQGNDIEQQVRRLGSRTLYGMHGRATESFEYDDQGVASSNGLGTISHVHKDQVYNLQYDTRKANIEEYKKQLSDAGLLTKSFEKQLQNLENQLKQTASTDVKFTIYDKKEQKVADKVNEALEKSKKLYADSTKDFNALGKAQSDYNDALAKNIKDNEKMNDSALVEHYVKLYEALVKAKEAMDNLNTARNKGEIGEEDYNRAKALYESDNIQQGDLTSRMNVRDAGISVMNGLAKARTNLNKAEAEYIKNGSYENQLKLNEATAEYVQTLNRAKDVLEQLRNMNQNGAFSDEHMTAVDNAFNSNEAQFGSIDSRNSIMKNADDLIKKTEQLGNALNKIDSDRIKSGKTDDFEQKRIEATNEWNKSLAKVRETLATIKELNQQGIIDDNQLSKFEDDVNKVETNRGTASSREQVTMSMDKRIENTKKAIEAYEKAEKRLKKFQDTAANGGHVSGAITGAADSMENAKKRAQDLITTLQQVNEALFKDTDTTKYQNVLDVINQLNIRMQNPLSSPDSGFENATKGYETLALNANTYLNIQKKIQSGQSISASDTLFLKDYGDYFKLAAEGSQKFIEKLGGVQEGSENAAEEQKKLNEAIIAYNKAIGLNKSNILNNMSQNIETSMGELGTKNSTPAFQDEYENLQEQLVLAQQEYKGLQEQIEAMDWNGTSEQDIKTLISKLDEVFPKFAQIQKSMKELGANKDFNPVDPLKVEQLNKRMSEWSIRNSGATEAIKQIKELQNQLRNVNTQGEANKIAVSFERIQRATAEAGKLGKSFADKLKGAFSNLARYMMSFASFYRIVGAIKQGIDAVREMDTAMTDLRKVVDASDISFKNFEKQSYKIAASVGTTAQTIVQAAAEWGRLGYSLDDSATLAKASAIYTNVGDIDATTATTDLVSAMKAFNIEASESMRVVDTLNEIGNNYAVSSAQLGEILKKSSSSLAVSGDTLEDVVAMGAAMNAVTQDASVTGSTLKVVGLRLRGAEADLKEAGEETEGMAISTSKLRGQIMALTKATDQGAFDIMKNPNEFKTTYEIIDGIAQRWDDIAQVDQAALLELMANSCHNIQKYI